jgi:hypothetical protein
VVAGFLLVLSISLTRATSSRGLNGLET